MMMSHLSLDLFRPVSIFERVVRVLVAETGRTNVGDHHGATVSPEGVLQEASKLAVAIWNVDCFALRKKEGVLIVLFSLSFPPTHMLKNLIIANSIWHIHLILC